MVDIDTSKFNHFIDFFNENIIKKYPTIKPNSDENIINFKHLTDKERLDLFNNVNSCLTLFGCLNHEYFYKNDELNLFEWLETCIKFYDFIGFDIVDKTYVEDNLTKNKYLISDDHQCEHVVDLITTYLEYCEKLFDNLKECDDIVLPSYSLTLQICSSKLVEGLKTLQDILLDKMNKREHATQSDITISSVVKNGCPCLEASLKELPKNFKPIW